MCQYKIQFISFAEDFKLAVAAIILLPRVTKRRFKRKSKNQSVRGEFKEREEEDAKRKNFYLTIILLLQTSAKVLSSLKLHLFIFPMFMTFFQ